MNNKSGIIVLAIAGILFAILYAVQGCSIYDTVKMNVPTKVQQTTGSTPTIPISEYPDVREQYLAATARNVERLDANYTDAAFWADLIASGINMGITLGEAQAAALPGGALLVAGLTGVGGLLLRKPGDGKTMEALKAELVAQAKALAKEKIDSYNKGLEEGKKS